MAGDKGAEVPKTAQEFYQRPKAVKDAIDYYKKPAPGNTFRSAISRAVDSLRRRGRQLPSNETAQRMVDKMNTGSAQEAHDYSSQGRTRNVRTHPVTDFNLRADFEPMGDRAGSMRYFDKDQPEIKSQSTADETPKPSEE